MKLCSKCKEWKDESDFNKNRSRKDGLKVWCKKCSRSYARKHYLANSKSLKRYFRYEERHQIIDGMEQRRCSKCKKWKKVSKFNKRPGTKNGLHSWCKDCKRAYLREYYKKKGKSLKTYYRYEECHRVVGGVKQKLCRRCKRWKTESDFYKNRSKKEGLEMWCKECKWAYRLKRYKKERVGMKQYYRYEERHRVVDAVKQKQCCRCKRWKAESEFYKRKARKDGLQYCCKVCANKATNKAHKK